MNTQAEELSRKSDVDMTSYCGQPSVADTLTIVTAASDWYFGKLIQLLKSLASYEPNARVVVYDIGLTEVSSIVLLQPLKEYLYW